MVRRLEARYRVIRDTIGIPKAKPLITTLMDLLSASPKESLSPSVVLRDIPKSHFPGVLPHVESRTGSIRIKRPNTTKPRVIGFSKALAIVPAV